MTAAAPQDLRLTATGKTLAVHVPILFRKRGGRKIVIAPSGVPSQATSKPLKPGSRSPNAVLEGDVDVGLVRAVVRAHRWQSMLDKGRHVTVGDLARAENLDKALVARTLRLTLLAPDIIEAILDGRQSDAVHRQKLLRGFPLEWGVQKRVLGVV